MADVIISDSSLDACSFSCVETDGMEGKSFDYCPQTKTCLLNGDQEGLSLFAPKDQAEIDKDSCAHYRSMIAC